MGYPLPLPINFTGSLAVCQFSRLLKGIDKIVYLATPIFLSLRSHTHLTRIAGDHRSLVDTTFSLCQPKQIFRLPDLHRRNEQPALSQYLDPLPDLGHPLFRNSHRLVVALRTYPPRRSVCRPPVYDIIYPICRRHPPSFFCVYPLLLRRCHQQAELETTPGIQPVLRHPLRHRHSS